VYVFLQVRSSGFCCRTAPAHLCQGRQNEPGAFAAASELGLFCEKAITGLWGITALRLSEGNHLIHIQVSGYATTLEAYRHIGLARAIRMAISPRLAISRLPMSIGASWFL